VELCDLEVFGLTAGTGDRSGTILDTACFFTCWDKPTRWIRALCAYIIGEYGDTELLVWSLTDIGRLSIDPYLAEGKGLSTEELDDLFIQMRDAVYHIIQAKGATLRYRHGMVR